ncbi:hypothetical protein BZA70DRAFT_280820, partial [Myxozyma melibiosi]
MRIQHHRPMRPYRLTIPGPSVAAHTFFSLLLLSLFSFSRPVINQTLSPSLSPSLSLSLSLFFSRRESTHARTAWLGRSS